MSDVDLVFDLHRAQLEIYTNPARFKVVAAGRRFGKSYLSAVCLLTEGLRETNDYGYDLHDKVVYYVAPTFQQAKDILWSLIKELGQGVIESTLENTGVVRLINGRQIHLKGSDRPDTLRGVGLSYVVLDEYASMKPQTWEEILRPTLADVKGGALFIGTPAGKNHFFKLFKDNEKNKDWATFSYKTVDNPFLDKGEIRNAKHTMSRSAFRQEFEASFSTQGGSVLDPSSLVLQPEPQEGSWYVTVDPAGFSEEDASSSKYANLDETSISTVKVGPYGWFIGEIQYGRWDVRETAIRILRTSQKVRPVAVGIEKGALKNALMPYIQDNMLRLNVFPNIVEVTHGGKRKIDRIVWALQGRLEHGRLLVPQGDASREWIDHLRDQMADFPNPLAHDDLLDSLAYIDQVATTIYRPEYFEAMSESNWTPMDVTAGY